MTDEQTNEGDTAGKETSDVAETSEETTEEKTPSQKLKEENDNLEKELTRAQKIRNEMLLGGASGGRVEEKPKEVTNKEYAGKLDRGEVNPMKDDGFE